MPKTSQPVLSRLRLDSVPVILLLTCLLAFGLFSPWLGFYQDDWHFMYYARQGLGKLWELSAYDNRPFASWPYIGGFALLGFRPFAWQVAVILIRWLSTVAFWLFFRALWPRQARLAVVPALLFAVYPLYTLQPMAVTYITHWVCYLLYALSLWLMVLAVRDPKRLWALLLLSVVLDAVQLFTIEYFNGIELLRPVVLWMALAETGQTRQMRIKTTLWAWLPYFLVLLAFVLWRAFVFQSPAQDNNAPTVLLDLAREPLPTLLYLLSAMLKDSLLILVEPWSATLDPAMVDLSLVGLAILALSALIFAAFYFYLRRAQATTEELPPLAPMLWLGVLGLLLGPVPAWVTRQPLYDTNPLWNSRLGMASMFGAALILTALVEWLVRTRAQRILVYSLLLALATGYLLRSENSYRRAWESELSFLNQLALRAPAIQPGTPVISEGEVLPLMGDYPTAFATNMLYQRQPGESGNARLWYFPSFGEDRVAEILSGHGTFQERKFSTRFEGQAADHIVIWYDPAVSACLRVLTPRDAESHLYSDFLQAAASGSALARISSQPELDADFIRQALSTPETWCTYFQKAELAEQSQDWEAVLQDWEKAQGLDLQPSHGAEYLPFLRASLATGNTAQAQSLTEAAARETNSQAMRQTLCLAWEGVENPTETKVREELKCEE